MVRKAYENAQVILLNNQGTTYTVGSQLFKGKQLTKNTVCKKIQQNVNRRPLQIILCAFHISLNFSIFSNELVVALKINEK